MLQDRRKVFSFQISSSTRYRLVTLDHSVYPDLDDPPDNLPTPEDKADYMHRICSAFDFGIFPERDDWVLFAGWRDIFDRFPLPHSPAYHTFRAPYGWPEAERRPHGLVPGCRSSRWRRSRQGMTCSDR